MTNIMATMFRGFFSANDDMNIDLHILQIEFWRR